MAEASEIYDFVVSRGTRYTLPGAWSRFKTEPAFIQRNENSLGLLAALQQRFSSADLLKAHVTITDKKGTVSLHPSLAHPQSAVLALRKAAQEKPFALLPARGTCLNPAEWAICQMLEDYRVRSSMEKFGHQLLIAFSSQDIAILRTFGLPVVPASGLWTFASRKIDTFCSVLGISRYPNSVVPRSTIPLDSSCPANESQKKPISLVLVGWSPADLDPSDPRWFNEVRQHLQDLRKHLELPLDDFKIWKPTSASIERIQFCLKNACVADVRRVLHHSLENQIECLIKQQPTNRERKRTYADAYREWISLQGNQYDFLRCQRALAQLQNHEKIELIEPLMKQAQEAADPDEKNLAITLAKVSGIVHPQSLLIAAKYAAAIREDGTNAQAALPKEEFQQWLAMLNQVQTLTQNLRAVRRGRRPLVNRKVGNSPLKGSDSPIARSPR